MLKYSQVSKHFQMINNSSKNTHTEDTHARKQENVCGKHSQGLSLDGGIKVCPGRLFPLFCVFENAHDKKNSK